MGTKLFKNLFFALLITSMVLPQVIGTSSNKASAEDCTADFTWLPQDPEPGDEIIFDASSSVGQIVSYSWDFGDNTTLESGEATVNHTYKDTGEYNMNLVVTTNDNITSNTNKLINVVSFDTVNLVDNASESENMTTGVNALMEIATLDTETLKPSGSGVQTSIRYSTGSPHWLMCRDDDSTFTPNEKWGILGGNFVYEYNWYNDNYYRDLYSMENPTQRLEGVVKVKWMGRIGKNTYPYGNYKYGLYTHGIAYDGPVASCGAGWGWRYIPFYNNPYTGLPWTLDEIDSLQAGVTLGRGGGYGNPACDSVWIRVCWVNAEVQTNQATNYTDTSARLNGYVTEDEDNTCKVYFQWGETTSYGKTTANQYMVEGDSFSADISGLDPVKVYHYRAVIVTDCGETFYGADETIPPPTPSTWSFAIITDLHIGRGYDDYGDLGYDSDVAGQDYYLIERLTAAVNWINNNKNNADYSIDFVVVMGDIADSAEKAELLKAKNILDKLNDPNSDGNTSDGIPYVPIFGNHDIWPYTEGTGGIKALADLIGQYFEEIFWTEPQAQTNKDLLENMADTFTRQSSGLPAQFQNCYLNYRGMNFIGLDFIERRETKEGVLPGAQNHAETITWLTQRLDELNGSDPVIVFSHIPFQNNTTSAFNGPEWWQIENILEAYEQRDPATRQLLGAFGGHIHGIEELWHFIDVWEDPNDEVGWIYGAPVILTESLMVGSNLKNDDLGDHNKGIIRIVKVTGSGELDFSTIEGKYIPSTGTGAEFIALNPRLAIENGKTTPTGKVKMNFKPSAFTKRDIEIYSINFDDEPLYYGGYGDKWTFLMDPDTEYHKVTLYARDDSTDREESIPYYFQISQNVEERKLLVSSPNIIPVSITWDEDATIFARTSTDVIRFDVIASPAKPVAMATIHFEQATADIDMLALVADYDRLVQKSIFYMPAWPSEVEEYKTLLIPYTQEGTVYVCPNATSLEEVNPLAPGTVYLEPGELVDGMMAIPIIYEEEQYYMVQGFINGGGGVNLPPVADANGPYSGEEGSSVLFSADNATDSNNDPLLYRWDFNNDGVWDTDFLTSANSTYTWYDDYSGEVMLEVFDGEFSDNTSTIVNISNVSPTISSITAPLTPVLLGTTASANATFFDSGTDDTHTAIWDWGDNATSAGIIDEAAGSISGNHTYTTTGVYTITLTVTDDDGASVQSAFRYIVVYNPEGGFVTGGGWINSPEGACVADPSLTGKANFGFNCRYQQGGGIPTGEIQFNFKEADLKLHSTGYEWLVINGAQATFQGEGTINGEGSYKFQVTVIDGDTYSNDGYNEDLFRIKIWEEIGGNQVVVYDSGLIQPGGGSIKIHSD